MGSAPAQLVSLGKGGTFGHRDRNAQGESHGKTRGRRAFASPGMLRGHQGLGARPGTGSPLLAFGRNPRDNTFTWDWEPPALWENRFLFIKLRSLENQYGHQPESGPFAVGHPPRGKLAGGVSGQPKQLQSDVDRVMPFSVHADPQKRRI